MKAFYAIKLPCPEARKKGHSVLNNIGSVLLFAKCAKSSLCAP